MICRLFSFIIPFVPIARQASPSRSRKVKQDKPQLILEDLSALEDLQSLVDSLLDEEENEEETFLILLRLSPIPKYLVRGYDFKMLNKYTTYLTDIYKHIFFRFLQCNHTNPTHFSRFI